MTRDREAEWAEWLRAANRGDGRAYARFLTDVVPVLRGIIRARGRGLGEATVEDVVQEVLLAVHTKRHTWREADPIQPWLYAIARYKVVDAFRRRGKGMDVPIEDFAELLPAPAAADPTERSDMLRVIGQLDERSAGIVRAIGLDGASVRETGARYGMNETAVRVTLHRSMKRLAQLRARMIE
jgi:RNA polymerase sigma-70 factor (ECF subfamily)